VACYGAEGECGAGAQGEAAQGGWGFRGEGLAEEMEVEFERKGGYGRRGEERRGEEGDVPILTTPTVFTVTVKVCGAVLEPGQGVVVRTTLGGWAAAREASAKGRTSVDFIFAERERFVLGSERGGIGMGR
jgi:hypothetical protein